LGGVASDEAFSHPEKAYFTPFAMTWPGEFGDPLEMAPPRRPSARLSHDFNIDSRNFTDDAEYLRYLL